MELFYNKVYIVVGIYISINIYIYNVKMSTTLYMDKETRELLEQIKNQNNDFNLSQFVKKHLGLEACGKSESQENLIMNRITESKLQRDSAEATLKLWEQRLENYKTEQQSMAKTKELQRLADKQKEKESKDRDYMIDILQKYFEVNGYEEYKRGIKEGKWKGTVDFFNQKFNNDTAEL